MKYARIRDLREDNDYTQAKVGEYLNISQRTYSYYENGEHEMPIEVLSMLADLYNTSTDYLLNRTDKKEPYT